jgi:hypothetical protein
MNCQEAQDEILTSDDPAEIDAASELGRHVASCAVCQAMVGQLVRLEAAARQMPTPGSQAAREFVKAKVRSTANHRQRPLFLRPAWLTAAAAMLLIGVGISYWTHRTIEQNTTVVEELIDWDVSLAEAPGADERQQIYTAQAPAMQRAVQRASLNDEDRRLATTLLEHGAWLSKNADPVERAERYCDLSDLVVARMGSAAAASDAGAVQRLGARYGKLQKGLGLHLDSIHAVADVGVNQKRLERIAKRSAEQEQRLQMLAERAEQRATQKALKRALEQSRRPAKRAGN